MNVPKINLKELEEMKRKNFEERLNFIELYAKWLKENRIKIEKVEE